MVVDALKVERMLDIRNKTQIAVAVAPLCVVGALPVFDVVIQTTKPTVVVPLMKRPNNIRPSLLSKLEIPRVVLGIQILELTLIWLLPPPMLKVSFLTLEQILSWSVMVLVFPSLLLVT